MRVGFGYDVHRFKEGRRLILGGVDIKHDQGLDGHSDADVLLHALMDGLLGAAALGDIGTHFPPTDPAYKGISSLELLREVYGLLRQNRFQVGNIDSTIVCERPKLAPFISEMEGHIARVLDLDIGRVSVKATTTEGLGFTGTGQGIAAHAVVLIEEVPLCSEE